jgi:hypothetical protein
MKKFGINTVVIGALSFVSGWLGWWEWDFALIAFLVAFAVNDGFLKSNLAAFIAIGGVWFFMANSLNAANESLLANTVSNIMKVSSSSQLMMITSLVGALVGGFSAMTGSFARDAFLPKRNRKGERI